MYTNIDTDAALLAIGRYLETNQDAYPSVPVTALLEGLKLVMRKQHFHLW